MTVEAGHLALWLATGCALALAWAALWGAARGDDACTALAVPLARSMAALVAAGYAALTWAFASTDFSVSYVAQHAHSTLPLAYRLAGVWGGHEGSLLLWITLLAGWTFVLTRRGASWPGRLHVRVLGVLGLLTAALLLFMLLTSNPFVRLVPAVDEGRDLNPLLQDPGMVLHPPLLYLGYVGFAVTFAFAMAALLEPDMNGRWGAWARAVRPWCALAWAALTAGIALGSWWAYHELGWGGWWFWDPVENASLMPWLSGTALLHTLIVVDQRGALRAWALLLAILSCGLSLLGTFLVRSGVLSSVHAFATDPRRGLYLLGLLVLVMGAALALYGARAQRLGLGARFHWRSRETGLLANNVMLIAACAAVLLGTLYPMVLDALTGQKISVGAPYFESAVVPLLMPMLLLLGLGPMLRWGEAAPRDVLRALRLPLLLTPLAAGAIAWRQGQLAGPALPGLLLAAWIALSVAADLGARLAPRPGQGLVRRLRTLPRATWAMAVAHLGMAVFVLGTTQVSTRQQEDDLLLAVGEQARFGAWTLRLDSVQTVPRDNHEAQRATVRLQRAGGDSLTLHPEKRRYLSSEMPMTEAGIEARWDGDLYVALGERVNLDDGRPGWVLRVADKPWVGWIWGGCVLMACGGLLSAADRRWRRVAAATGPALS